MKLLLYIIGFIFIFWPLEEVILKYWIEKGDKCIDKIIKIVSKWGK